MSIVVWTLIACGSPYVGALRVTPPESSIAVSLALASARNIFQLFSPLDTKLVASSKLPWARDIGPDRIRKRELHDDAVHLFAFPEYSRDNGGCCQRNGDCEEDSARKHNLTSGNAQNNFWTAFGT